MLIEFESAPLMKVIKTSTAVTIEFSKSFESAPLMKVIKTVLPVLWRHCLLFESAPLMKVIKTPQTGCLHQVRSLNLHRL